MMDKFLRDLTNRILSECGPYMRLDPRDLSGHTFMPNTHFTLDFDPVASAVWNWAYNPKTDGPLGRVLFKAIVKTITMTIEELSHLGQAHYKTKKSHSIRVSWISKIHLRLMR